MRHRKLFPSLITPTNNQTDNCPYNCYPYPSYSYLSPPPLAGAGAGAGVSQRIPSYVIIIVAFLASLFLLVSYYAIIVKYCSKWNLSRAQPPTDGSDGPDEEEFDGGPALDHHIWYIATVGLQPSVINSITVFRFKKGDSPIEGSECSVCLSEFQEDETLRLLPKCNHGFHIHCIDTWLRSHTNCPLCRAGIVSNSASTLSNSHALIGQNEDAEMENLGNGGHELGGNLGENSEVNRAGTEEDEDELPGIDDGRKEFDRSIGDDNFRVFSDLGMNKMMIEDELVVQTVRRSISMDDSSCVTAANVSAVDQELVDDQKFGNPSSSNPQPMSRRSADSMNRSVSHGGRFFFQRNSRNTNSVLPL